MLGTYQTVQAATADPKQLLLMLLNGGTSFLDQALRAHERGDRPRFSERVSRAHAVIVELTATLDHTQGGELARSLDRLYDFMLRQLTLAPSAGDAKAVATVRGLLETIRSGFDSAVKDGARAARA